MASAAAAIAAMVAGAAIGAYGEYSAGQAAAGAAHYNAAVDRNNAAVARKQAEISEETGQAQVGIQGQRTRAIVAATTAHEAASGVDVNSGSYANVRSSERELGVVDALNLRTNAAKEAYGFRTKATSFENESTLKEYAGENYETQGKLQAASTLLGGLGSAGMTYETYKQQGGFGGDSG